MKIILIALMCLMAGCKPLLKTQTKQHNNVVVVDSTITQVIKKELEKQLLQINTTIIEFEAHVQNIEEDSIIGACISSNGNKVTNNENTNPINESLVFAIGNRESIKVTQPIKRIIKIEASQDTEKIVEIDSTERRQLNTTDMTRTETKLDERQSDFVQGAKWIGVILSSVLLIFIILRFR